jgi:hypothetical protein
MQKMTIEGGLSFQQELEDMKTVENSYLTMEHVNEFIKDYENYLVVTREKSKRAKKGIEKFVEEEAHDDTTVSS